jgi:hypothetical protein
MVFQEVKLSRAVVDELFGVEDDVVDDTWGSLRDADLRCHVPYHHEQHANEEGKEPKFVVCSKAIRDQNHVFSCVTLPLVLSLATLISSCCPHVLIFYYSVKVLSQHAPLLCMSLVPFA